MNYVNSDQFYQIYFSGLSYYVLILEKTRFGGVKAVIIGCSKKDNLMESFVDIAYKSC
jgi:hypothetical protein